ncbi:MAG: four helix bundle protein [Clostridia bacterium]|nr:four helix bundle protein [Clostridia bacterium]
MKGVSNTRIYLDCARLLDRVVDAVPQYPRDHKHTIGARTTELTVGLVREAAQAYLARDARSRLDFLRGFEADFETLRILIRLAGERHWIKGLGRHAEIIELIGSIGRQSSAWKASTLKAVSEREGHVPES